MNVVAMFVQYRLTDNWGATVVEETRLLTGTTTMAGVRDWVERQRAARSLAAGRTLKARIVRTLDVTREMYGKFKDAGDRTWPLLTEAERKVRDAVKRHSAADRELAEMRVRRDRADARDRARNMRYGDD